ncbi:MAG: cupin domain-containing protein [Planctomycetota bacterium]
MSGPTAERVSLPQLPGVPCPCGTARRAFADAADFPATVHLTEISAAAKPHFHKRQTEVYVILDCGPDAALEVDGERLPVKPLDAIRIPPGVVHRAVGEMQVLIVCSPKFDPADEFVVEPHD